MEPGSDVAAQRLRRLVERLPDAVVGLDFDGTLSPVVSDPAEARIHPEAPAVLLELAARVRTIAIITGRPARQAIALGGLDDIGSAIGEMGRELHVYGQYGFEHWSSSRRRIVSPRPPHGLSRLIGDLPRVLRRCDAAGAAIEEKGLAVAVHTRTLPDPAAAFERLLPALTEVAHEAGLSVEPGKYVVEIRSGDMDKGRVVRALVAETDAEAFLFAGDDRGDVEAFQAITDLRAYGLAGFLVCSASEEESVLQPMADLVVDGPDGVLRLLRWLARDATA